MADEYIKREDAIDYIEGFVTMNKYYHPYSKRTTIPIAEAIARINETPSADVQPVMHGKWILKEILGVRLIGCSVCCKNYLWSTDKYCPNCGARMDGE